VSPRDKGGEQRRLRGRRKRRGRWRVKNDEERGEMEVEMGE
jgi:hypothetical protein